MGLKVPEYLRWAKDPTWPTEIGEHWEAEPAKISEIIAFYGSVNGPVGQPMREKSKTKNQNAQPPTMRWYMNYIDIVL